MLNVKHTSAAQNKWDTVSNNKWMSNKYSPGKWSLQLNNKHRQLNWNNLACIFPVITVPDGYVEDL